MPVAHPAACESQKIPVDIVKYFLGANIPLIDVYCYRECVYSSFSQNIILNHLYQKCLFSLKSRILKAISESLGLIAFTCLMSTLRNLNTWCLQPMAFTEHSVPGEFGWGAYVIRVLGVVVIGNVHTDIPLGIGGLHLPNKTQKNWKKNKYSKN